MIRLQFPITRHFAVLLPGAAAGGGGVRGDEIKENIVNMVGRDKAKQEACFSLEQFVFRAVLAGR